MPEDDSYWTYGIVHHPTKGFCMMEVHHLGKEVIAFSDPYTDGLSLADIDYFLTSMQDRIRHQQIYQVDNDWKVIEPHA